MHTVCPSQSCFSRGSCRCRLIWGDSIVLSFDCPLSRKTPMFDLASVQAAIREFQFDAWLLCDFRGSNLLARRILDLADRPLMTRRFFYVVPALGEPHKLVHRIEPGALDHLPGGKTVYLRWQELE